MKRYFVYIDEQSGNTLFFETEQTGRKNFCGIFYISESETHWKRFNGQTLQDDPRKKQEYIESDLELLRDQMYQSVNPARDAFLSAGFIYDNGTEKIPFQTDPASLQKMGLAKTALDSAPEGTTIVWTTNQKLPDGTDRDYTFSKTEFTVFFTSIVAEGDRIHHKARAVKSQILAAETLAELKSVKISFVKEAG